MPHIMHFTWREAKLSVMLRLLNDYQECLDMWQRIIVLSVLSMGLLACTHPKEQSPQEMGNNASLCEILKQKITVEMDQNNDPATMKRKNATDQALLLKQYDSYGCPEIIDSAPPP